jgi:hypothetical protein
MRSPWRNEEEADRAHSRAQGRTAHVRKMDFLHGSTGSGTAGGYRGACGKPSAPGLSPYLDGREELVRGVRFRGFNARSLKDILAAGDIQCVRMDENGARSRAGGAEPPRPAWSPSISSTT